MSSHSSPPRVPEQVHRTWTMRYTGICISLLSFVYTWGERTALWGLFYNANHVTSRDVFWIYRLYYIYWCFVCWLLL